MLTSASLTDGIKLKEIRTQFEQAGSYLLGVEYLTFVNSLLLLKGKDEDRFDRAQDSIQRLSKNELFATDYKSWVEGAGGKQILPDLGKILQYIDARKLEAYGDREAAIAKYEAYPVLDAVSRAGELTSAIRKEKYKKASALLAKNTLEPIRQAAAMFEELGNYIDSQKKLEACRKRIVELVPRTPVPSPTPTAEPVPTPVTSARVPVYYMSRDGALLFTDQMTCVTGDNMYYANDAFVPSGYELTGSRSIAVVLHHDGTTMPASLMFTYEKPPAPTSVPEIKPIQVGSYLSFGQYEQDNDTTNGKEPISWQVLAVEGDRALLAADVCLDCEPYYTELKPVTWETCSVRKWLGNDFLNAAFTAEERKKVLTVTLKNENNPEYGTQGGNDTTDRVFLLSIAEAEKYFKDDEARKARNTVYAKAKGVCDIAGFSWWWLRTPGFGANSAATVTTGGSLDAYGFEAHNVLLAVRPAVYISVP